MQSCNVCVSRKWLCRLGIGVSQKEHQDGLGCILLSVVFLAKVMH
jgi:hypothetical protein